MNYSTILKTVSVACALLPMQVLLAQLPEKVGGLITADRNAAIISKAQTPHAAFSSIIDKTSTFYVPSAVNAFNYLNNRPNIPDVMAWEPNFALVSKSLEFGVTSGNMEFQKVGAVKRYGQYLTIWKRDKKGVWKVDLRAEVENYGKQAAKDLTYQEPDDSWYLKHRSQVRLKQREDIISSTDQLFSTISKRDTEAAYREFMADEVRFYYPWQNEIEGKNNVVNFIKKQRIDIVTEPLKVGRTYSGEYAYSQGTATIHSKEKAVKFNYIRVWKLQDDFQWRVILEMMFER
ncbi:YybH family protein [Sphingobacterium bovistauri]|uniref:Nuclear transport factor 2 family protein n=1 Tax=Sphingobacterium bovistauri TaxID=2781959 RepID=A0ABS7Z4N9_9SPHI|nr:nuclear transport factor 2 family protein [Sphingobacterium bovistauri]MCA5004968.1 nuclear transport factor 2 family protein [Sphingobacterium bovistauri]